MMAELTYPQASDGMSDTQEKQITDLELMKMLAKTVAEEVVREMKAEVREEVRDEIRREFKNYFGEMSPSAHAIQHNRFDKFLNRMDKLSDNFWGQLVAGFIKWFVGLAVIGYIVWTQSKGHA